MRIARDELFAMLRRTRPASAERRLAGHEEDLTILAADSAGFSRKTFEHGVVRFLANMTRVCDRVVPLIERHRGAVTTQNADNVLAVFARPADAVSAALAIQAFLARRNARASGEDRYELCLGVRTGRVLRLRDDVFGAAVNVCAKIGEDVAKAGETLVTREVLDATAGRFRYARAGSTTIGGRRIALWRLRGEK